MLGFNPVASAPIASAGTNYTLTLSSQALSATVNSVALASQDVTIIVTSQNFALAQNSVTAEGENNPIITSQTATATLNGVALDTEVNAQAPTFRIFAGLTSVSLVTDQVISVSGQSISASVNGLRLWGPIDTIQPTLCSGQPPAWNEIVFGDLLYGDNFAIAATPIASIIAAPPIRKNPPQAWDAVATATTTAWETIET